MILTVCAKEPCTMLIYHTYRPLSHTLILSSFSSKMDLLKVIRYERNHKKGTKSGAALETFVSGF